MSQPPHYGRGSGTPSRGAATPSRGYAASPGAPEKIRRVSGGHLHPSGMGASRMSPGPSIYRTMPGQPTGRSTPNRQTPSRQTPSHLVRPIPQHMNGPGAGFSTSPNPFSPITVPKINQSPVRKAVESLL